MKLRACFLIVSFLSAVVCTTLAQTAAPNSSLASTQVPRLIKFSGVAKDESGKLMTGAVGITLSLYKDQQGGSPLWVETQNVQADAAGHYTAMLGSASADGVPLEVFSSGEAQWLGVQIQGQPAQARVLLVSVPYALKAHEAETLSGRSISDFVLLNKTASSAPNTSNTPPAANGARASGLPPSAANGPTNFVGNNATQVVSVTQKGTGAGLLATSIDKAGLASTITGMSNTAVYGLASNTSKGSNADGVYGQANTETGSGVEGLTTSPTGTGVLGMSTTTNGGTGVSGIAQATSGNTSGVFGQSSSPNGNGVSGNANATSGFANGVNGQSTSSGGNGVYGAATATSGFSNGVNGQTNSPSGTGVFGINNATSGFANGVAGESGSTTAGAAGVNGFESSTTGQVFGVSGATNSSTDFAAGVRGTQGAATGQVFGVSGVASSTTTNASGVNGFEAAATGQVYGVAGATNSSGSGAAGLNGYEGSTTGQVFGVNGSTNSTTTGAAGVSGFEGATTGQVYGVTGGTNSTTQGAVGVSGYEGATTGSVAGVAGGTNSTEGEGVFGSANATSGRAVGVIGQTSSPDGAGGAFTNLSGAGLVLQGLAGKSFKSVFTVDARGNGFYAGNLNVTGKLTKGSGSFKIDHPLDPANKYLSHSFVESPDMMNVYNGNVTTDRHGFATVNLPDYFEALNGDFRYQLTVIGQFAQAIVAKKIASNTFVIRTSRPHVEVSWQVTGIRHDAYANAYRIPVEEEKAAGEQGYYLHPEVFGQPESKGISAARKAVPASQDVVAEAAHN